VSGVVKDYKKDLEIDKYALDAECMDQPRKFMEWSENLADAMAELDRADQKLDVKKAQVEQDIRKDPDKYYVDKVTDASVKAAVTVDGQVKEAHEAWVQAKHQVGILMAARGAMEQRRSMLENLVKLFLSGYWADPKVKPEHKETMAKESFEKQKEALNKSSKLSARTK
jgi:transposase